MAVEAGAWCPEQELLEACREDGCPHLKLRCRCCTLTAGRANPCPLITAHLIGSICPNGLAALFELGFDSLPVLVMNSALLSFGGPWLLVLPEVNGPYCE